jgi:hypothetical protein
MTSSLGSRRTRKLWPRSQASRSLSAARLRDFVARSVDFDNEPALETDEVEDIIPKRNLPLKLRSFTSSITNRLPDNGFGLNSIGALFARETKEEGSRHFTRHRKL